jgi:hypothetical protein
MNDNEEVTPEVLDEAARLRRMISEEMVQSKLVQSWFYISFADDDGFRGGCYIQAFGPASAMLRANVEKISPGGEARVFPIPREAERMIPADARNRLLTKAELERYSPLKSMKDLEAEDES